MRIAGRHKGLARVSGKPYDGGVIPKRTLWIALGALAAAFGGSVAPAAAVTNAPLSPLATARARFAAADRAMQSTLEQRVSAAGLAYRKAIEEVALNGLTNGNPAGVLAMERELARFEREASVPADPAAGGDPPWEVKQARRAYHAAALRARFDARRSRLAAIEALLRPDLADFVRRLTSKRELEAAREGQRAQESAASESQALGLQLREDAAGLRALSIQILDAGHEAALDRLAAAYVRSLDALIQRAGNRSATDEALAVMTEKRRFIAENDVPRRHRPELDPSVRVAAWAYVAGRAHEQAARTRAGLEFLESEAIPLLEGLRIELIRYGGREELVLAIQSDTAQAVAEAGALRSAIPAQPLGPVTLPPHLHAGLALHYMFDLADFDFVLDRSGAGHHAEIRSAGWTPFGRVGAAAEFDGTGCLISRDGRGLLAGRTPFTLSACIRTRSEARQCLIQQRDPVSRDGEFQLFTDVRGEVGYEEYADARFGARLRTATAVNDGQWHHIVLLRAPSDAALYVDGVLAASALVRPIALSRDRTLVIGCDYAEDRSFFRGSLDEVMVFRRALSREEIRDLHGLLSGAQP